MVKDEPIKHAQLLNAHFATVFLEYLVLHDLTQFLLGRQQLLNSIPKIILRELGQFLFGTLLFLRYHLLEADDLIRGKASNHLVLFSLALIQCHLVMNHFDEALPQNLQHERGAHRHQFSGYTYLLFFAHPH